METLLLVLGIVGLVLVLALLIGGTAMVTVDAFSGRNPFATLWLVFGGLGQMVEVIGSLVKLLLELVAALLGGGSE